jgi:hypothetical protein
MLDGLPLSHTDHRLLSFRCAFAAFGGIFFGYDSGYINGVTGSRQFIELIEGSGQRALSASNNSLIVSILSAGTFFGASPRSMMQKVPYELTCV